MNYDMQRAARQLYNQMAEADSRQDGSVEEFLKDIATGQWQDQLLEAIEAAGFTVMPTPEWVEFVRKMDKLEGRSA